ncbi:helicase C-terminal domain-containing protein [Ramlibacter alkalitolerans]|uniref:DEAD/DEAH box helicase family protein n=1 Tax=Ramlibacter alkalitolerans TaxID=2039631 RepID=A0ABS1JU02_9BURK|nr:helicase C-terminal domain-containing protein [Ramlibacter alkalitolerans]MBL0427728.1 DEAD/DEAH box helicase family protein [Ramlibacter alkalitolerans]
MGSVVTFKPNKTPAKDSISVAYAALVAQGLSPRPEQEQLSRDIFLSFMEGKPYAAEAPTGTGKTLAYLIGALAAREAFNAPVVVATATIALQEQIINNDLPLLAKTGLVKSGSFAVAKGRGRYFCPQSAVRFLESGGEVTGKRGVQPGQHDMFDSGAVDQGADYYDAQKLMEAWDTNEWDGDSDSLKTKTPKVWRIVQACADTCLNKRCDFYEQCPFFKDRAKLAVADIIVANHDLVFADLAMSLEDKDSGVFPTERYMLVVDEAHHIGDKAIKLGEAKLDALSADENLKGIDVLAQRAFKLKKLSASLRRKGIAPSNFETKRYAESCRAVRNALLALEFEPRKEVLRFAAGGVPAQIIEPVTFYMNEAKVLRSILSETAQLIRHHKTDEKDAAQESAILFELTGWLGRLAGNIRAAEDFLSAKNLARWAFRRDTEEGTVGRLALHVCPLDGVELLTKVLWENERCSSALVSATLRDINEGFDRFKLATGLPADARTRVYPYVLPYQNSTLCLPSMENTPKDAGFQKEMEGKLLEAIEPSEATLVLFNSRAMMLATVKALENAFGRDKVLVQDSTSMQQLLASHRARIDAGKGSILLGVQKMAEGLDLPGDYLTHLVITRLPFGVPDTPVEQERQEQVGSKYFSEYLVPDALLRLVQMVGRLVRRETDVGRITLLDSRARNTAWGRKMLKVLPPFRVTTNLKPAASPSAAPSAATVASIRRVA